MITFTNKNIEKSYNAFLCSFSHEVEKINLNNESVFNTIQNKMNEFVYWYNMCMYYIKIIDTLTKRIKSSPQSYEELQTLNMKEYNPRISVFVQKLNNRNKESLNETLMDVSNIKNIMNKKLSYSYVNTIVDSNDYLTNKALYCNNRTTELSYSLNNIAQTTFYELDLNDEEINDINEKARNDSNSETVNATENEEGGKNTNTPSSRPQIEHDYFDDIDVDILNRMLEEELRNLAKETDDLVKDFIDTMGDILSNKEDYDELASRYKELQDLANSISSDRLNDSDCNYKLREAIREGNSISVTFSDGTTISYVADTGQYRMNGSEITQEEYNDFVTNIREKKETELKETNEEQNRVRDELDKQGQVIHDTTNNTNVDEDTSDTSDSGGI